ncbi:MAG: type II secretion system protein GspF [Myxococcales bacterium]|nr:type II secretion system protein GspF [Myxococcales bacterium]
MKAFVDAETLRAARSKLRREGIFLTEIEETDAARQKQAKREVGFGGLSRVSVMDTALATRQLATLVSAGIPLVDSLRALTEQVESAKFKGILGRVRDRVNEGTSLADALYPEQPFNDLYVSMVRAGETGGALDQVLLRLAEYLEGQVRLQNRVMSIVIYPLVMLGFAVCVVAALVTFVLPQITTLLESLDQELPIYTRVIMGISDFARSYWWAMGVALAGFFIVLRAIVRTERGRESFDALKLRVPVLGKVTRILAIARFSRTLSTLLAGGIPIVKSLEIAKFVANNAVIGAAVDQAKHSITEGSSLAAPLRASGEFPPLVVHMVDVGERSGELESMLARVAETYDEQVENSVTRMTSLLEPLLILLMVGVVLAIIFAVLSPMLQLTGSIQ